ncbi:MAG: tetratricopeptide repeat protein, partial [Ignavibacteria bacterium]|nr:tetratricopeptide repeat protein [Ignavibacteria bacterium]
MKILSQSILSLLLFCALFQSKVLGQSNSTVDSLIYKVEISKDDSTRITSLIEIANYYSSTNLSLSFQYADKALEIAEQSKNKQFYSQALMAIGNICFYQGLTDIAFQHYSKALSINKETENNKGVANALTNLGGILLQLMKFDEAKRYFHEALPLFSDLAEKRGDTIPPFQVISIYNNLGIVHENLNEYNQAIDYYHRGISLASRMPNQQKNLAMLHNNLGSIYMKMGEFDEAFKNMDASLMIRKELNDKGGEASSYRMLGILYKSMQNYEKALNNFYYGYDLATSVGNTSVLSSISEQLFEVFDLLNQSDSALKYHILLKDFSDKLKGEETLLEFTRMDITSQFQEKEKIRLIEQRKQKMRYLFIAILMLLIVVILGLLYVLSQSRLRRLSLINNNIQLASEKADLEKGALSKELEIKNKELTTNVIYQIRKNELINNIADKLMTNRLNFKKENQSLIKDIIKELESSKEDSIWMEFETRFHHVHNEFYEKLNEVNPDLSPNERRLCAFLRLNMTTKEISSITGQSLRSIDVARTRLRQKLNLTNAEIGLIEYLSNI